MNDNKQSGGISFCGLLTIAFIVLKLTGFISWSWLWVLSPVWIPASLVCIILLLAWLLDKRFERKITKMVRKSDHH